MNSHGDIVTSSSELGETTGSVVADLSEKIIMEDSLAEAMLTAVSENEQIQQQLVAISNIVIEKIFEPIKTAMLDVGNDFKKLKDEKGKLDSYKYKQAMQHHH